MFPLPTRTFPTNAADLARLMNESLQRLFIVHAAPVTIEDDAFPNLRSLRVNLDRAQLRGQPPRPPTAGEQSPALQVGELTLEASQLNLGPATADLRFHARDVLLDQSPVSADEILLVPRSAADGSIEISADKSAIETAIAKVASAEAGKQGVTIEGVRLAIDERGPRGLSAEVEVKAKKLFFSTVIRLAANLDLDDELNASISGVTCRGDGAIGSLACGFLAPHLEKVNNRTFPLMALPLGEIRLRDVRLSANDRITVQAEFGNRT